jgi:hypothetical protein
MPVRFWQPPVSVLAENYFPDSKRLPEGRRILKTLQPGYFTVISLTPGFSPVFADATRFEPLPRL